MALIERNIDPAVQTVRLLRDTITGSYNQLVGAFNNGQMLVWNNPYGLTPQQVLDAMGSDAAALFDFSARAAALINHAAEPGAEVKSLMPEGVVPAINVDGTVTLKG